MSKEDTIFGAKLFEDEFSPQEGSVKDFWMIPKSIAGIDNKALSYGAKLMYAVLIGLCYQRGTAWASKKTLQKHMGSPSLKTLYLWQCELVDARLIRVHQKGRGLPNNYYLLRSPLLGNMKPGSSDDVMQVYKDPATGAQYLKPHRECMNEFIAEADAWYEMQKTERTPFPKPNWRYNRRNYREIKEIYEGSLKYEMSKIETCDKPEQEAVQEEVENFNLLAANKAMYEEINQLVSVASRR